MRGYPLLEQSDVPEMIVVDGPEQRQLLTGSDPNQWWHPANIGAFAQEVTGGRQALTQLISGFRDRYEFVVRYPCP